MDCEKALREVERYLDGELQKAQLEEIRLHLEDCPPCTDRAEFSRHLRELIARKCGCTEAEVPDSLRARVASLLEAGED